MHHSERVQNLDESNVAGEHSVAEGQRADVDEGPPREGLLLGAAVPDPVGRRTLHDVALRARKGKGLHCGSQGILKKEVGLLMYLGRSLNFLHGISYS